MTTDAITAARARLAALEVNPLWGHEKQTAEIRKDALAIFDELTAALVEEAERDAQRQLAAIYKLDREKGIARTECLTAEMERDAALARRCPYLETVGGETWCFNHAETTEDYTETMND